jgi:hypothetical protein
MLVRYERDTTTRIHLLLAQNITANNNGDNDPKQTIRELCSHECQIDLISDAHGKDQDQRENDGTRVQSIRAQRRHYLCMSVKLTDPIKFIDIRSMPSSSLKSSGSSTEQKHYRRRVGLGGKKILGRWHNRTTHRSIIPQK